MRITDLRGNATTCATINAQVRRVNKRNLKQDYRCVAATELSDMAFPCLAVEFQNRSGKTGRHFTMRAANARVHAVSLLFGVNTGELRPMGERRSDWHSGHPGLAVPVPVHTMVQTPLPGAGLHNDNDTLHTIIRSSREKPSPPLVTVAVAPVLQVNRL